MKDALIIIDVQNDYFPGETCELHKPYEAEERIIIKYYLNSFLETDLDEYLKSIGVKNLIR